MARRTTAPNVETAATTADVFGEVLRYFREEARLTQKALAQHIPCDRSQIAHIEAGARVPHDDFVKTCDRVLGTNGALMRLWVRIDWYPEVEHPDWFKRRAEMDAVAVAVLEYQQQTMPGLLQTEEYATAQFGQVLGGVFKSRTAPTAPGTHSRPTGRKPKYVQYESFRPAHREHAPDTADTAQDLKTPPRAGRGCRFRHGSHEPTATIPESRRTPIPRRAGRKLPAQHHGEPCDHGAPGSPPSRRRRPAEHQDSSDTGQPHRSGPAQHIHVPDHPAGREGVGVLGVAGQRAFQQRPRGPGTTQADL